MVSFNHSKILQQLSYSTTYMYYMNLKKYLPSKGTDIEVGGIISAKSKKNTVNDRRIEMDKDT